jgi:hypothetical protein
MGIAELHLLIKGMTYHSRSPWFTPIVGEIRVAHLLSFLYCVFALFIFVQCLEYPIFSVSLDCSFLISLSIFSNVYLRSVINISINHA